MSPALRDAAASMLEELLAEYPRNRTRAPFAREAQPWPLQLSKAHDCLRECQKHIQNADHESSAASLTRLAAIALLLAADVRDRPYS